MPWSIRKNQLDETESIGFIPMRKESISIPKVFELVS